MLCLPRRKLESAPGMGFSSVVIQSFSRVSSIGNSSHPSTFVVEIYQPERRAGWARKLCGVMR